MATVYSVVTNAGFSGSGADTMTAICLAESGGNAWAYNPDAGTGDDSYGLAQINMIGSLGPARRAEFGLSSDDDLFDPATNLRVAYSLSQGGQVFSAWTTYTRGLYQQHLGDQSTPVTYTPEHGSPNIAGGSKLVSSTHPDVAPQFEGYPSPPYVPTPMPPLSTQQRTSMRQWLITLYNVMATDSSSNIGSNLIKTGNKGFGQGQVIPPPETVNMMTDAQLTGLYAQVLSDLQAGNYPTYGTTHADQLPKLPGWLQGLGDVGTAILNALRWLTSVKNWERVGLMVLGALVLLVVAAEFFKSDSRVAIVSQASKAVTV